MSKADDGKPGWDDEKARDLIGATVLVGLTHLAHDDEFLRQEQLHGKVVVADRNSGVCVELAGTRNGERFWLPPTTEYFEPAAEGVYTLRSTGEKISNPDFLVTFTLTEPPPDRH